MAEKTGISVPFMTQIELGRKSASLEVVQNIAAALNISYKQLFEENIAASNQEKTNLSLLEQNITSSVVKKKIHEEFIKIKIDFFDFFQKTKKSLYRKIYKTELDFKKISYFLFHTSTLSCVKKTYLYNRII
ncbi:MAG: helix-turn-helix transcriptional regulator [Treponema sp.]|nr:MAG: helix-turn-helix transcriptional regulator [Treponema sp.]